MKNVHHPCCGLLSLQIGTKIVAIFQIVTSSIVLFSGGVMLLGVVASAETQPPRTTGDTDNTPTPGKNDEASFGALLVVTLGFLVVGIFSLLVGIMLLKGATQRNSGKCRAWLIIRGIFLAISLMTLLSNLVRDVGYFQILQMLGITLEFYMYWVVYAFVSELNKEEERSGRSSANKIISNNEYQI